MLVREALKKIKQKVLYLVILEDYVLMLVMKINQCIIFLFFYSNKFFKLVHIILFKIIDIYVVLKKDIFIDVQRHITNNT